MPFDTLTDYLDQGCSLSVECESGHFATVLPWELQRIAASRCWGDRIEDVAGHLKCKRCGARPKAIVPRRGTG